MFFEFVYFLFLNFGLKVELFKFFVYVFRGKFKYKFYICLFLFLIFICKLWNGLKIILFYIRIYCNSNLYVIIYGCVGFFVIYF